MNTSTEVPQRLNIKTKSSKVNNSKLPNLSAENNNLNENENINFIFDTFLHKIAEAQNYLKLNEHNTIIDVLIKIFDTLSVTIDSKFKIISENLKIFCDTNPMKHPKIENDSILAEEYTKIKNDYEQIKRDLIKSENVSKEKLNDAESTIQSLKKKYEIIKNKVYTLNKEYLDENKTLKTYIKDCTAELEFLRDKESKLMKVIYLIHKRGISIDEIIGKGELDYLDSKIDTNESFVSTTSTIYFPDKTTVKNNYTNNVSIPRLDFNKVPHYESENDDNDVQAIKKIKKLKLVKTNSNIVLDHSVKITNRSNSPEDLKFDGAKLQAFVNDSSKDKTYNSISGASNKNDTIQIENYEDSNNGKNKNKGVKVKKKNLKINFNNMNTNSKVKDYNAEFLSKFDEFSESWRKEIKPFKDSIEAKNIHNSKSVLKNN